MQLVARVYSHLALLIMIGSVVAGECFIAVVVFMKPGYL